MAQVLLGKQEQLRLALCCLLARGHLLIEDRPGMGKSTLAEALARGSALDFKRVSFTSDLLPARPPPTTTTSHCVDISKIRLVGRLKPCVLYGFVKMAQRRPIRTGWVCCLE